MEQFCADLQIDPSDVLMLVLAWRLDADVMCCFTREQFRKLQEEDVKTMAELKQKLPQLMSQACGDAPSFKSLYNFTFKFGLDKDKGERVLPIDIAIPLWQLIFSDERKQSKHLDNWFTFLKEKGTRGITRDVRLLNKAKNYSLGGGRVEDLALDFLLDKKERGGGGRGVALFVALAMLIFPNLVIY